MGIGVFLLIFVKQCIFLCVAITYWIKKGALCRPLVSAKPEKLRHKNQQDGWHGSSRVIAWECYHHIC